MYSSWGFGLKCENKTVNAANCILLGKKNTTKTPNNARTCVGCCGVGFGRGAVCCARGCCEAGADAGVGVGVPAVCISPDVPLPIVTAVVK